MAADTSAEKLNEDCQIAMEAAVGVALDHCTDDAALQKNIGKVVGVEPDPNCEASLKEGLNEETCTNSKGVRQWVACRAHQLLKAQELAFNEAMSQAWTEAAEGCDSPDAVV
jgi:hypothetical protein